MKENSLAVQWLGLWAFTAEGSGSIPGWRTKIPKPCGIAPPEKKNNVWKYIERGPIMYF